MPQRRAAINLERVTGQVLDAMSLDAFITNAKVAVLAPNNECRLSPCQQTLACVGGRWLPFVNVPSPRKVQQMKTRSSIRVAMAVALAAALSAALVPTQALAFDENSTAAVNVDAKGIGLQGHDPVAYFTVGAPTLGKPEFKSSHASVTYQFASAANRDLFKANPAKYAPQYGGFCAMGVAYEKKFDGDPKAWHVVDNKLYVNVNKDILKQWLVDVPGNNKKADSNWPELRNKTPKSLM